MKIYLVVDFGCEGIEDVLTASTDKVVAIRFAEGAEVTDHLEVWEVEDGQPNEMPKCIFRVDA